MRIIVNPDLCSGHGRCASVAPDVYELDDDGFCAIVEADVARANEAAARAGANNCPERAISIVD